jgi:probable HAF family extracellular repeat protein
MRSSGLRFVLGTSAVLLVGCDTRQPLEPARPPGAASMAKGGGGGGPPAGSQFATLSQLPALKGSHGEAYAVNQVGSLIAGYSWDRTGRMIPATWRLQNGAWTLTTLPYAASASSAVARAVNDQGDVAGNDFPANTPHAVLWPSSGGFIVLGCGELGDVYGMSAGGRILVGSGRDVSAGTGRASVWQPGSCREDLPPLVAGGGTTARAINGDGTIVGGGAGSGTSLVPVRWTRSGGSWQVEQLDSRPGLVFGANAAGDLVGSVQIPCTSASQCHRGIIWYAAGGSRELGTLGGESTSPRAINSAGEVVGLSTLANGTGTAFFWSATLGMRQLPGGDAWAFGVSGVRTDGTRIVVGAGGQPFSALVWLVRNP